jgi:hypothetical protein
MLVDSLAYFDFSTIFASRRIAPYSSCIRDGAGRSSMFGLLRLHVIAGWQFR